MDARIGQLMKEGEISYYAYVNGVEYVEGSLNVVEHALGLPLTPSHDLPVPVVAVAAKPVARAANVRDYAVTITPRYKMYWQGGDSSSYTEVYAATSRDEAIKLARREYSANFDMNPAKFRAVLVK